MTGRAADRGCYWQIVVDHGLSIMAFGGNQCLNTNKHTSISHRAAGKLTREDRVVSVEMVSTRWCQCHSVASSARRRNRRISEKSTGYSLKDEKRRIR